MLPLIGRERQLRILLEAVTNPPALVEVSGEAGIGKSRLVHELVGSGRAGRRRMLRGHCHRVREQFTLGPVIEALRDAGEPLKGRALTPLVGTLRPLLPELSDFLPSAPDPLLDPRAQRYQTFRALRELLEALGPTVCVLEDLHWVDSGTLEFLSFLLAQPLCDLALVLTWRGEDLDASHPSLRSLASGASGELSKTMIELPPFSVDEVRAMAVVLLDNHVPHQSASSLHARTGGIPFAVEEVVRAVQERRDRSHGQPGLDHGLLADLHVPPRVSHSVLERVARLSADALAVAHASAVVGEPATEDVLRHVAELTRARALEALIEALRGGMLTDHGGGLYGLRHALAAQAVYEDIPTPQRRRLHLRAAWALELEPGPRPLAQIAHHFMKAGRSQQWVRYAEAAAEAACAVGEDRTGAAIIDEVLSAPGVPRTTRIRMAMKLGDAALFGRVPRQAIRILQRTLDDACLPPGVRGELRLHLARLLLLAGDVSYYGQLVRASEELRRRPWLAARTHAILATWGSVEGDQNHRLAWSERAVAAAARQGDSVLDIEVLTARAVVLLDRGDPVGWRVTEQMPWQTGSVEERLALVRACKYLAKAALQLGHYRRAEGWLDEGERIRRELGHNRFAVGLATVRASLEWSMGAWGGLEARTRKLIEATQEAPGLLASNQVTLGSLLLARGQEVRAKEQFLAVRQVFENAQTLPHLAAVTGALARIHLSHGDAAGARELTVTGLARIHRNGTWACASSVAPAAVDGLLACGEADMAEDVIRRLARGLRGRDAPGPMAALAFCRGAAAEALDQHAVACDWFAQSEVAWRQLPCPYRAAQARERHGRSLLFGEEPTIATPCLLDALEEFERLGAASDSARVRTTLRAHRIAAPSRAGRKGYGSELSPRETQVADLVSRGATNREIAEALVISQRTVESHVASSLKKLGVDSRRAIPRETFGIPK